VRAGDVVVFTAFGGGVTWGSVVLRWGDRVARLDTSDAALDPVEVTVDELLAQNREFFAPLYD
jgi:3-oxoacyl-[acyl-carrier-protein] synthase-3